jgi:hypothetical protein
MSAPKAEQSVQPLAMSMEFHAEAVMQAVSDVAGSFGH